MSNRGWERFTYPSHYPELNDPRSVPKRPSLIEPERRRTEMLDHRDRELERYLDLDRIDESVGGAGGGSVTVVVTTPDSRNPEGGDFTTTGTSDQNTIQEAIDAIPVNALLGAPVGTIVLREGTYNIDGPLSVMPGSLIRVRGEFIPVIFLAGSSYVFSELLLWESVYIIASGGTDITVSSGGAFADCTILGSNGSSPVLISPNTIRDSAIQSITTAAAIQGGSISATSVPTIINSQILSPVLAIDGTSGIGGFSMIGNIIFGRVVAHPNALLAVNTEFTFAAGVGSSDPLIDLNDSYPGPGVYRSGLFGCRVRPDSAAFSGLLLLVVWAGGPPTQLFSVKDNIFDSGVDNGSIVLDGGQDIDISGNTIYAPASSGGTYNLIELVGGAARNRITHNDLGTFNETSVASGVDLDATTIDNLVCFNTFQSLGGTYITDAGINTITCPGGV